MRIISLNSLRFISILALGTLLIGSPVQAMSVSWQGSTAVMTANQSFLSDWLVAYSFRNDMAIGARLMRTKMTDGSEMLFYAPQFDYLVKRWNAENYQANLYADVAFGLQNAEGKNSTATLGTFEGDIESRELYASFKVEGNWAGIGPNLYQSEIRLGIAPYKADYDELASWLMVSVQNNPGLYRVFSVTPLVRIFYKSVLLEAGSNLEGDWMLNSMIHF